MNYVGSTFLGAHASCVLRFGARYIPMQGAISANAARWKRALPGLVLLALLVPAATALARPAAPQTQAETVIVNRAEATYSDDDGRKYGTISPTVTVIVRAVSGVNVTPDETAPSANVAPRETITRLFRVCNTGNTPDSYTITRGEVTAPAKLVNLYFDSDGSGTVTPGDTLIAIGTSTTPRLAPGECLGVLAVVDTADSTPLGTLTISLTARSNDASTANGPKQDDGTIINAVGAGASLTAPDTPQLPPVKFVEDKARVTSSPGQPLTYSIAFRNRGAVPARRVLVVDDLPAELDYLAGTLRLDGRSLTDADDADEGRVTGRRLEVRLNEVAPNQVVQITFVARLNGQVLPGVGVINAAVVSGENIPTTVKTSEAVALINPFGTVYEGHSAGAVRINGAKVVLSVDQAGGSPLKLTSTAGVTPNQQNDNPFATDLQGHFNFTLTPDQLGATAAPATYYVNVTAPGYRPRVLEVQTAPLGNGLFTGMVRALDGQPVARAGSFDLTTDNIRLDNLAAFVFNVPLFESSTLVISKIADKQRVEIGDVISYRVEARNATAAPVSDAVVTDLLPASFHYVPGTARVEAPPAAPRQVEPEVSGNQLVFRLGEIGPGLSVTISYRVRVGVNAREGEQFNSAVVKGKFPSGETVNTPPARSAVVVGRGVFSARQVVIGRVFEDANGNGIFDAGERPVAGVRLYLSNGNSVITDSEGQYNLPSVNEGSVVISLDPITVPAGYLLLDDNLRAGHSWTRLLRTPLGGGSLLRQNFALIPKDGPRDGKTVAASPTLQASIDAPGASAERSKSQPTNPQSTPSAPGTYEVTAEEKVEPVPPGEVRIILPAADEVILAPSLRVAACVAKGWATALEVNGQRIPDSSIGERREDHKHNVTTFSFIGLNLHPGPNRIKATALSPEGKAGRSVELTVYGRGPAKRLEIVSEKKELPAGGRESTVVRVRAFDQWDHPAADAQVGVETSSGRLLLEGCGEHDTPKNCRPAARRLQAAEGGANLKLTGAGSEAAEGVTAEQVNENVRQQVVSLTGGEALLRLVADNTAGDAELRANVGDIKARSAVRFTPELRPQILAGLAEVSIGRAAPERAIFHEDRSVSSRINLFYRGSILHQTLLTLAYDSRRPLQRTAGRDRLFQLDPLDRLYPLFGDSSTRFEDAQSNSKLYARLDRGRSYAMFGDFSGDREETGTDNRPSFSASSSFAGNSFFNAGSGRALTNYARNLTGVKVHAENASGDFISVTGARPDTAFARDIFPGGSFSLLRLTRSEVLQGSETVVLEVRDRRNPDIILSREPLVRSVDYNLDPLSGAIFLLRPISTFDYHLNLLQLVVTYEYLTTGLQSAVYTARGVKRFGGLRLGASFVNQRQAEFGPYYLGGIDGEERLPRGGSLQFEWGLSNGRVAAAGNFFGSSSSFADAEHNGQAYRADLTQPLGFKEAVLRASFARAEAGFFNPFGGTVTPGSRRAATMLEFKARPSSLMRLGFLSERNKTFNVDNDRVTFSAAWTEAINERLRLTAGYDYRKFDDAANKREVESNLVTAGAEFRPTEKLQLEVKREQNLSGADPTYPNQTTIAASYQFNTSARVFFTQRLASAPIVPISDVGATGFASVGSRRETAIGVETRLGRYTSLNSHYQIENSINGTDSFAVFGLTNRLPLSKQLAVDFGFERGFHLDGAGQSFNSASLGFAWQPLENFRSSARYELRDRQGFGQIITFGAAGKINDALSALGRFQFARANFLGRGNESLSATAALALRPLQSDRAALLFSYNRRSFAQSGRTSLENLRDRGDTLSSDGLMRLSKDLELYGRFALKFGGNGQAGLPYVSTLTYLGQGRLQHRFAKYFDAAAELRWLAQPVTGTKRTSTGAELGFWVLPDLRLGAGYNLTGVKEPVGSSIISQHRGAYFTISSKLSNLFDLFGTSREGLVTVSEAEEHNYLASNFAPDRQPPRKSDDRKEQQPAAPKAESEAKAAATPRMAVVATGAEKPAAASGSSPGVATVANTSERESVAAKPEIPSEVAANVQSTGFSRVVPSPTQNPAEAGTPNVACHFS